MTCVSTAHVYSLKVLDSLMIHHHTHITVICKNSTDGVTENKAIIHYSSNTCAPQLIDTNAVELL